MFIYSGGQKCNVFAFKNHEWKTVEIKTIEALLDSGASGKFIDQNFSKNMKIEQQNLEKLIKVYNVDGTLNKQGTIRKYVNLNLEIHG